MNHRASKNKSNNVHQHENTNSCMIDMRVCKSWCSHENECNTIEIQINTNVYRFQRKKSQTTGNGPHTKQTILSNCRLKNMNIISSSTLFYMVR